jgi:hypothetical protein
MVDQQVGVFQLSICRRCKQKIPKGQESFIPKLGTFCIPCVEVLIGDDDYIDPYIGEKLI